jgi:holo-[acyl-carrier protein] synthase
VSADRERLSEAGGRATASDRGTGRPAEQLRVGLDLLEIERLERALERRPRLAERLFTDSERLYAAARARPGQHLAARFCAKEAVAKALELGAWSFRDVEVIPADGEAGPGVRLSGRAAARATALGVRVSVSLTHTRQQAAAVAVASAE